MKIHIVLLTFFLLPIYLLGNASVQDSLLTQLAKADDSTQLVILEELAMLPDVSADQRLSYLIEVVDLAQNVNHPVLKAEALYQLGHIYRNQGDLDNALAVAEESLNLFKENDKLQESAKPITLIGVVYIYLENFDMALNHFERALEIRNELGDEIQIVKAMINLGNLLGLTGKLDEAMEYYKKALKIKEDVNDLNGISQLYNNIANIYFAKGEMEEVLAYRLKALEMDREMDDKWQIALKTYNLAEYYLTINEPKNAYPYIIESKAIAENLENSGLVNDNIQFLSLYHELLNDNKNALEYQKLYAKSIKETFSKQLSDQIGEMEVKYKTEKKEKESEAIKNQLGKVHRQKLVLVFISIIGILITIIIFILFYRKKKDGKALEKKVLVRTNELSIKNTELKRNSLELVKAKDKAEESDRLKSAFLSNMSHEIRTPMNGILGFTDLLLDSDFEDADKEKFIGIIHNNSSRLLNTIDNIIEASKIETTQLSTFISKLCVNELVEEIYNKFDSDQSQIKFSFNNELSKDESNIFSDKSKIDSILTHLIKNAFKFTKEGDIDFGYKKKNNFLEFYIKDSGVGIPSGRQKAIFDLFVKSDIEDHEAFQGSGLGLSIAKSYVELLGGKMWVISKIDIGSIFYFTIPYKTNDSEVIDLEPSSKLVESKCESNSLKILIVEDDIDSDNYLTTILGDVCDHIWHASNGIEAVDICRQHKNIDLILMDIKMPIMDGIAAVKKIREFNKNVYIIAQTAHALIGDMEKSIEAGCNDYISKPIKKEELLAKIMK